MIPGEFLVATAVAVGITVPVATVIEVTHPPVDMARYEMRVDCEVGDVVLERCLFDVEKGEVLGGKP
mgnify:CR=1 FL=1